MIFSNETDLELEAKYVKWIGMMFIRCFCLLMIPFGIIGHSLSIYVFTRRSLRTNSCTKYLLAATVSGLLSSCFILPMRLIQAGYIGIDPTAHSMILCKLIWFLLYSIRLLCFWFVVLACVDRYLCSSPSAKKRAWSSIRVASRAIYLTVIIIFLIHIHILIIFKVQTESSTNKPVCHPAGPRGLYRKIFSFFNLIVFGFTPPLCMFIFGLFTLRHAHRKNGLEKIAIANAKISKPKASEKQLLRMLLTQVIVYCISGMVFSIALIKVAMNTNPRKTVLDIAHENFVITIVGMLSNIAPSLSFYLYTLSSRLFRKELKKFFHRLVGHQIQRMDDYTSTNDLELVTMQLSDQS